MAVLLRLNPHFALPFFIGTQDEEVFADAKIILDKYGKFVDNY